MNIVCKQVCSARVREWALRQGWGGRPVRAQQAQGILVAVLGVSVSYYGYVRRKFKIL